MEEKQENVGRVISDIEQDIRLMLDIQSRLFHKMGALRRALGRKEYSTALEDAKIETRKSVNINKASWSVKEFCKDFKMAHSTFYKIINQGHGPKVTKFGTRRTIILAEDIEAWKKTLRKGVDNGRNK